MALCPSQKEWVGKRWRERKRKRETEREIEKERNTSERRPSDKRKITVEDRKVKRKKEN